MKKSLRTELQKLFFDVARKCESRREWDQMLEEIERIERQHRRGRERFAAPVSVSVQYFACKAVLEAIATPTTWQGFNALRRDYQIGQALREQIADREALEVLELRWSDLAIDYVADIVG